MTTGGFVRVDASETANLANNKLPKYVASILCWRVIAYTLKRDLVSGLSDTDGYDMPQRNEYPREEYEKRAWNHLDIVPRKTARGTMLASN